MKKYLAVCAFKGLNIKVIYNDKEVLYEGSSEEVPYEIGNLMYSNVVEKDTVWNLYVYSDEYKKD